MASENDHHTHKSICNACLKQAGCRSLADTVPQTGTIVLGHIVGDGDTKSCIHKYRKLIHFRRCRISGNCLCSQCINGSLHGKLADAHNRHLKSHTHVSFYHRTKILKIFFLQSKYEEFSHAYHCT